MKKSIILDIYPNINSDGRRISISQYFDEILGYFDEIPLFDLIYFLFLSLI